MHAVLEKVAAILPGKSPNECQSDDPIGDLARIEQRRVEIFQQNDRVLDALASFPNQEADAYRAFDDVCKNGDTEAIKAASFNWALLAASREPVLRQRAVVMTMKNSGSLWGRFGREPSRSESCLAAGLPISARRGERKSSAKL
jgi:hypothetical protein